MEKTEKEFDNLVISFKDVYFSNCTLEDFPINLEETILFGVKNPRVQVLNEKGTWDIYPIPEGANITSRMVLTRSMVNELLPYLENFVRTGKINRKK